MAGVPSSVVQLRALVQKEVAQITSDPRMIRLLVVAPLIQLLVFGYAVNFEIEQVPTAIVDQDHTATSRGHSDALVADGMLARVLETSEPEEALAAMDRGQVAAVVILPEGLDADRMRGRPAPVQVVIDGTDARRSTVAAAAAAKYFAAADAKASRLTLVPRVSPNPTLDSQQYMVPGLAAMVLVITTTMMTAMGLAREREVGTLEQVLVTPILAPVLLLGKMLPYVGIGLFNTALTLGLGALVFSVPMRGNLVFLLVATLAYLLSTLGAGLLVATFARSQQQAFMGGFFFMIPAILLSGNMTPVIAMPAWMQPVTYLNPLRWYIEILRANLLEGSSFAELSTHLAALLAIGGTLFVVAVRRFRMDLG
ncbi:MAG: ABC transporter permease [Myxococcota bacterium]